MGSAGLLMSELDWMSTSLDRDLATEALATLVPPPTAPHQGWDEPSADPGHADWTSVLVRIASLVRGRAVA